ncbi:MAG: hypothetical protein KC493_16630 [Bacteriovoracaceae bacterium]|nr:hypothetical protein [Bacteriovoracaceae bacterium]
MSIVDEKNYKYFQYFKEQGYPIYVRVDLSEFNASFLPFLIEQKFEELSSSEVSELDNKFNSDDRARLLTLQIATPVVSKQINMMRPTDKYGQESIVPKTGYKVYRYAGVGMMVYSMASKEWTLGCFSEFGSKSCEFASKSIVNRFLSWSLSSFGVISFWGVPVDEGVVVLNQDQSNGEAVYIDVMNNRIFSLDGVREIKGSFCVLRLDSKLKNRNISMRSEELLSFLSQHTAYLDDRGLSVAQRQMVQAVTKMSVGIIHPLESFKPRTDLSL